MNTATHLQHMVDGRLYPWTKMLAKRKDLMPVTLDADGNVNQGGVSADVPGPKQQEIGQLLARLRDVEAQQAAIIDVIAQIPGGQALLDARNIETTLTEPEPEPEPETSPAPPSGPATPEPAAPATPEPAAPVPATPEPVAPVAAADDAAPPAVDPALEVAEKQVSDAEIKVGQQEKYLTERTQVRDDLQEEVDELDAALETAEEGAPKKGISADLKTAKAALKQAEIKVKSATTKLANANARLGDANEELDELLNSEPAE